ncbi:DNA polymerase III subunit gamma/tau [Balneolaceae bacterium ANBcel3]|nr:DNA polymerase III subunit gamma/tau [Balneolaceae bacterium ANBcel3]
MSASYKALTRAYRPQTFDDIVSQEHVSNTLKNAIANNRMSHAYLFCGPRGVGKTTMARVLARTLNNVDLDVDAEQLNNTLNIVEIDAASNNGVDDVRALRERVRIPPQSGSYKIYIIDEVHMLSKPAFNALLKTLEEPPPHVIFIFATTEPHRILPTILSRCQRFDFRRITIPEIVDRLEYIANKESIAIGREALHVIAKKADGALRDALGILDQAIAFCGTDISFDALHKALNIVSFERMFELTDTIIRKDVNAGMKLIHHLLHIGNDIQEFLGALTEHFRNLYLSKDTRNLYLIDATDETKSRLQEMAGSFSSDDLLRMMHILHEAQHHIRTAQQPRIHLEITLLKLYHMSRTDGLEKLLKKLDHLEKTIGTGTPAPASGNKTASREKSGKKPSTSSGVTSSATAKPPANQGGDVFGTPSLQRPVNHLTAVKLPKKEDRDNESHHPISGNLAIAPDPAPAAVPENDESDNQKVACIEEIQQHWTVFLNDLRDHTSNMVYFTLAKTRPVTLKDQVLELECSDSFTVEIVREHQKMLCRLMNNCFGVTLRLTTRLAAHEKRTDTIKDPYEDLNRIQKKDPLVGKIVHLFGAELEY